MIAQIRLFSLCICFGVVSLSCTQEPKPALEDKVWLTSIVKATERASKESKPVLIDFGADWCKPCKRMHAEVFVDAGIEKRLRTQFVPVLVDATDMTPQISKLVRKYRVSTLPTIVFLDAQGKFLSDQSLVGFADIQELDTRLSQVVKLSAQP